MSALSLDSSEPARPNRSVLLRRAFGLEWFTIAWNVVEGVVAIAAGLLANSVALIGFGLDSFVESSSAGILVWRLKRETTGMDELHLERLEKKATRLVGVTLFILAAYIFLDATWSLFNQERPQPSPLGIALTSLSLLVMGFLARAKRRLGNELASPSLLADATQTRACFWLSLVVLAGIGLNAAFGWWWADPIAAIGMAFYILKEGLEAWDGDAH